MGLELCVAGVLTVLVSQVPATTPGVPLAHGDVMEIGPGDCGRLVPDGGNAYFSLAPGRFSRFEGEEDGRFVQLEVRVLPETEAIELPYEGRSAVVITRVIEERQWADGELIEVSRNYFARCEDSDNIYYFGEDVEVYDGRWIESRHGSWRAGVDQARAGLMMPGKFVVGASYYQEFAPPVALDRARNIRAGITVETPLGSFDECVAVLETSPLEPEERSIKVYSRHVGLVVSNSLRLVEFQQ